MANQVFRVYTATLFITVEPGRREYFSLAQNSQGRRISDPFLRRITVPEEMEVEAEEIHNGNTLKIIGYDKPSCTKTRAFNMRVVKEKCGEYKGRTQYSIKLIREAA